VPGKNLSVQVAIRLAVNQNEAGALGKKIGEQTEKRSCLSSARCSGNRQVLTGILGRHP
jgi:hypothetical protein